MVFREKMPLRFTDLWYKPALISYFLQMLCQSLSYVHCITTVVCPDVTIQFQTWVEKYRTNQSQLGSLCFLKWQTRKVLTKIRAQN